MSTTGNARGAQKKPSTSIGNSVQNDSSKSQQKSFAFGSSTPREFSYMAKSERQSRRNEDPQKTKSDSSHNIAFYMRQARSITPVTAVGRTKGWAFGSSTPREFSYLKKLKTEHQVYDAKCAPNETPKVLVSKSAMTLTEKSAKDVNSRPLPARANATVDKKSIAQASSSVTKSIQKKPQTHTNATRSGKSDKTTKSAIPPKEPADKPGDSTKTPIKRETPEKQTDSKNLVEIANVSEQAAMPSTVPKEEANNIEKIQDDDSIVQKNGVSTIIECNSHQDEKQEKDIMHGKIHSDVERNNKHYEKQHTSEEKFVHNHQVNEKEAIQQKEEIQYENDLEVADKQSALIDFTDNQPNNENGSSEEYKRINEDTPNVEKVSQGLETLDLLSDKFLKNSAGL